MGVMENKRIIREYIEKVVNTGNMDHIDDYLSEDYTEVHNFIRETIGIEEAKNRVLGIRNTYPDFNVIVDQQIAEGDWVATCCTMSGTHLGEWLNMEPTGKKVSYTAVVVDKIVDGKIVEHGGAANVFDAFYELGIIKVE